MASTYASSLPSHNSTVRIEEFLDDIDILIVDVLDVILSEKALFHIL